MRRLPLLPTLIVAAAVAVMVGLGIWQLQRAEWKERLIAETGRADALAPRPFRCHGIGGLEVRAGQNRAGDTGYRYLLPCGGGRLLDIGWSKRPDALATAALGRTVAAVPAPGGRIHVAVEPMAPLEASRLPAVEDIPNNHLFYAFQWFFFAIAAVAIYVLALRRRSPG